MELVFERFLGEGASGVVSLFTNKEKSLEVAIKTFDHAETLRKEVKIMSEFKGCPRIVQCFFYEVQERVNDVGDLVYNIPMEYASGGTLRTFMKRFKDEKLPDPYVRKFTHMILEGLATVHGRGYVHCDLKPENILVFPTYNRKWRPSYELKISDFGLTRREGDTSWWTPIFRYAGTPIYMSPESILYGEACQALDLWSLGCVVLEMYTGKSPWWHTKYDLEDLKKGKKPLIPSEIPCDARDFIVKCFMLDIDDERRDASTLLEHCFVRKREIKEPPVKNEIQREIDLHVEEIRRKLEEMKNICV